MLVGANFYTGSIDHRPGFTRVPTCQRREGALVAEDGLEPSTKAV